jgi:hypothetical protein
VANRSGGKKLGVGLLSVLGCLAALWPGLYLAQHLFDVRDDANQWLIACTLGGVVATAVGLVGMSLVAPNEPRGGHLAAERGRAVDRSNIVARENGVNIVNSDFRLGPPS